MKRKMVKETKVGSPIRKNTMKIGTKFSKNPIRTEKVYNNNNIWSTEELMEMGHS